MRNLHNPGTGDNSIESTEEALERLLEWGESTYVCDRLCASELLAKAEDSNDMLKLELASRSVAALGL